MHALLSSLIAALALTTAPSFAQPDIAKHPVQFTKGQGGASIYGG